jgi:hypothetical protein
VRYFCGRLDAIFYFSPPHFHWSRGVEGERFLNTMAITDLLLLEVTAGVYNLIMSHMRNSNQIVHDHLTVNRLPNYDQIVNVHGQLYDQAQTAEAIISIPDEIKDVEQAINYAKDYLQPYSRLLSFAQGHDIYFWGFRCFSVSNGQRTLLTTVNSSIRTGRHPGPTYVHNLHEFLTTAVPLLRDEAYNEQTGLDHALMIYGEASHYPLTIEVRVALFFIGLETLANSYWATLVKSTSKTWLFEKPVWSDLWRQVTTKLDELSITDKELRERFQSSLCNLTNPPIERKDSDALSGIWSTCLCRRNTCDKSDTKRSYARQAYSKSVQRF